MAKRGSGCLVTLGVLACVGAAVFGFACLAGGLAEAYADSQTYVVAFGYPGQECDRDKVTFSTADGKVLACRSNGVTPMRPVAAEFPGFSRGQDEAVMAYATQLGQDGVTLDERDQIQQRVNQIAATVPAANRPHDSSEMRVGPLRAGALAWTGAGLLVVVTVICLVAARRRKPRRTN
jgi:hypothetical protein